jgi:glycosyltransferase involved in cell wall biosynthesis
MNITFLLGRRDSPTDGVDDYSNRLAEALEDRGHCIQVSRVAWHKKGRLFALRELPEALELASSDWILMQFTHLMWSRRGFPLIALLFARVARRTGSRVAVTIHDPLAFPGIRWRDAGRRWMQYLVMRALVRTVDHVFVTLPPDGLPWLKASRRAAVTYLPVGTNITPYKEMNRAALSRNGVFTIAVFGISSDREVEEIAEVTNAVVRDLGALSIVMFGRGSSEAAPLLQQLTEESDTSLAVRGLTSVENISSCLSRADALLVLRGTISTRRGTVIAAIAHGLPVVGYKGGDTGWPITEAGLVLGTVGDTRYLSKRLIEMAQDPSLHCSLREQNLAAFKKHFAWDRLAATVEGSLRCHR